MREKQKKGKIEPKQFDSAYVELKTKLRLAIDMLMNRKFAEEVEYLDSLKAESLIAEILAVDYSTGLKMAELQEREKKFGTNERNVPKPDGYFALLWNALGDFTLRILLAAAAFSIILNVATDSDNRNIAWIEGFAIFMAVVISSNLQVFNDLQKEKQFQKLSKKADESKKLKVIRDGKVTHLLSDKLLPGDIISISDGTDISCDGFVLEAHGLTTDESAMTGETDPIKKGSLSECLKIKGEIEDEGRRNTIGSHEVPSPILIAGTKINSGAGKYVVILVGRDSSEGVIRDLIEQESGATPLQQKLEKLATDLGRFGLWSAIFIMTVLFIRFLVDRGRLDDWHDASQWKELLDYLIIAITIIVIAIPEGLPLAVSLSLAYSVGRMLKDQNLVRKLQACETMGGANMICSDKTGTLTQNKMDLTSFWSGSMVDIDTRNPNQNIEAYFKHTKCQDLFLQACLCNTTATLEPEDGSKTDIALLKFGTHVGINTVKFREKYVTSKSTLFPFTSKRKRMSTILESVPTGTLSNKLMHLKGASEYVLEACNRIHFLESDQIVSLTGETRANIQAVIKQMANNALRTIGIAYKDIIGGEDLNTEDAFGVHTIEKEGFTLIAILGIKDLLRENVVEAVKTCKIAGISVRMVTGDNKDTARAIATECGILDPSTATEDSVMEGVDFDRRIGGVICTVCKTKVCDCPRDKKTSTKKKKALRIDTIQNKDEFNKIWPHLCVLARSRPEDKYALVTGLKELDHVVAVTGDGTNDAPALKKADVGFAMGKAGTEVAREAADIILLDDNFNSIIKAVLWGRNIYDSIRKFLQFQLTINVVAVGMTLFGSALYRMAILSAVQLLWINLIQDTLAALALATESPDPKILNRKPHSRNEHVLSRKMIKFVAFHGAYQLLIVLILTCLGDTFIPERTYLNDSRDWSDAVTNGTWLQVRFAGNWSTTGSNGGWTGYNGTGGAGYFGYVRSGRLYKLNGDDDFAPYTDIVGGTRHLTVVFDAFVLMQVFNFVNARKIEDEFNIFERIHKNPLFIAIVLVILGLQILLGMFGNRPLSVFRDGTNGAQWGIAFACGFGEWIVGFLSKLVPDKIFQRRRKEQQDLTKEPSKVLSIIRSSEHRSLAIRNSTVIHPEQRKSPLTLAH